MEIIRTVINTDLKCIKDFRDKLIFLLREKNFDEDYIFKIKLILDELTTNSYKHGNLKDYQKLIEIIIQLSDTYSLIKVKDEGEGIIPKNCQDLYSESGRGIDLVKKLADRTIIKSNSIACLILKEK